MRFTWLGHPMVEMDGGRVGFETRKTLALLVYLSLHRGPVSREKLSLVFWPDFDRTRAFANLRRTLSSLRASLGGLQLEITRDAVGLGRRPPFELDVEEFQDLVRGARTHRHGEEGLCEPCLAALARAVALYRADFLDGFNLGKAGEFDDWQGDQREDLRRDLAYALERLARSALISGSFEAALGYAKRWTAMDVYDEAARRALMLACALSGRPGRALRHYEDYEELLWEGFGARPGEEMREFRRAIGAGDYDSSTLERDRPRSRASGEGGGREGLRLLLAKP
jgi:DNA-binding SARP family transcriptional activator